MDRLLLHPAADTRVSSLAPDENQSDRVDLWVGRHVYWGVYRSLLRFELDGVVPPPPGAGVWKATLLWYQKRRTGVKGLAFLDLYGLRDPWGEREVDWRTQPRHDSCPADSVVVPEARNTWLQFDITALVRDWLVGRRPNHGLLLKSRDESMSVLSVSPSTRWPWPANWPRLSLRLVSVPPPPPPPPPPAHEVVTRDMGTFTSGDEWRSTPPFDAAGLLVVTALAHHVAGEPVLVRLACSACGETWFPDSALKSVAAGDVARLTPLFFTRYLRMEYLSSRPGRPGTIRVVFQGTT